MTTTKTLTCIAGLLLAATGALAQSSGASGSATGSAGTQAAAFQCGGIGQADQDRMKAEAAHHPLMLTFAASDGAYLADIDVEIHKGMTVVLQGHCNGPLMVVDLAPAGAYEISATSNGRTQRKTVTIGSKPTRTTFTWPAS